MKEEDYFISAGVRQEELRKINNDLDTKLIIEEDIPCTDAEVEWGKSEYYPPTVLDEVNAKPSRLLKSKQSDLSSPSSIESDLEGGPRNELKTDTILHLQRSKENSLSSKVKEASKVNQEKEKNFAIIMTEMEKIRIENKRLRRELKIANAKESGKRITQERQKNDLDNLTLENQSLRKELSGLKSIVKESEEKCRANEVRLNRALASVEKLKVVVAHEKIEKHEPDSKLKAELDQTLKQLKNTEKQRNNLSSCVKEQMKLVEVLKRQKIHVEASKLLDITEKEFLKVLDWESKMSHSSSNTSCRNKCPLKSKA